MDKAVQDYVDSIDPAHRPLYDRLQRLVLEEHPDVEVVLSYKMPAFRRGRRRLFIAAWKHGISLYGWAHDEDGGLVARHPELKTSTGTLQLRPSDAERIFDDELRELIRNAL